MAFTRFLRHLFTPGFLAQARFGAPAELAIADAITAAERGTSGEIRFAVESALTPREAWADQSPRDRALEVFGQLGVWDTELRNGVLIYVLMADRDVEIVADRGAAARIPYADWEAVCRLMEEHFRAGRFQEGALAGIAAVGALLAREFPVRAIERDELPNQPSLL